VRLINISVFNWCGLGELRVGPLSPHLNLVDGPNESGKSRLTRAIRFGLFESSKGNAQHKQALRSWNAPGSQPRVHIRFEVGGREYEVEKRFLSNSYTRLAGDGRTLMAEKAEERLHELLGTHPAKRPGPTTEDLGIWPLLLVEQGDSRRAPHECMNEDNRTQLQDRLAGEIGQAAAGPLGQQIIELAWREYQRYLHSIWPGWHSATVLF
jgi:hypothetical protein